MPDVNTLIDKALTGLIWLLPGVLLLVGLLLFISYTDRRSTQRDSADNETGSADGQSKRK